MSDWEPEFRVIETLLWSAQNGPQRLEQHLSRMAATCNALQLPFPEAALRQMISDLEEPQDLRLRLTVDPNGTAAIEHWTYAALSTPWVVKISEVRLQSADVWLGHKTTRRAVYDAERTALPAGIDEWIFLNERGEICEGTITNLFVKQDGILRTPPLASGLLPGVLRAELIEQGAVQEAVLTLDDLLQADEIFCGNSLRGLIPAQLGSAP